MLRRAIRATPNPTRAFAGDPAARLLPVAACTVEDAPVRYEGASRRHSGVRLPRRFADRCDSQG